MSSNHYLSRECRQWNPVNVEAEDLALICENSSRAESDDDDITRPDPRIPPTPLEVYPELFEHVVRNPVPVVHRRTSISDQSLMNKFDKALSMANLLIAKIKSRDDSKEPDDQSESCPESSPEPSIATQISELDVEDALFFRIIKSNLWKIMETRYYAIIEMIDSKMNLIALLQELVMRAHYPVKYETSQATVRFGKHLVRMAECQTFTELENSLTAQKDFRKALRDYYFLLRQKRLKSMKMDAQSAVAIGDDANDSLNKQTQTDFDEMEACGGEEPERTVTGVWDISQPFLGDSSVRPKVPPKYRNSEESYKCRKQRSREERAIKDSPTLLTSVSRGQQTEQSNWWDILETSEVHEDETTESHPEVAGLRYVNMTDLKLFYQEMTKLIAEFQQEEKHEIVDFLNEIKQQFHIADLIFFVLIAMCEQRNFDQMNELPSLTGEPILPMRGHALDIHNLALMSRRDSSSNEQTGTTTESENFQINLKLVRVSAESTNSNLNFVIAKSDNGNLDIVTTESDNGNLDIVTTESDNGNLHIVTRESDNANLDIVTAESDNGNLDIVTTESDNGNLDIVTTESDNANLNIVITESDNGNLNIVTQDPKDANQLCTATESECDNPSARVVGHLILSDNVTWQGKIRHYYKHGLDMDVHLPDRLHPRHTATKLKKELCHVCGRVYRWPHLLHCFHKFCFPCVVKLYEEDRKCIKCPICERLTILEPEQNGPHSLVIDNIFAREMFEASLSPFCCTLCFSTEDAIMFCTDCLQYMCLVCSHEHCSGPETFGHNLEKTDMKVGATNKGSLGYMCPIDPGNIINKYCSTCKKPTCDVCAKDHSSHKVQRLEEVVGNARERFKTINTGIMEMQKGYQIILMSLNQSKQSLDSKHRTARRQINEVSNTLLQQTEVMRKRAHVIIDDVVDNIHTQAMYVRSDQEAFHTKLTEFMEFTSRYMLSGDMQEIVNIFPVISEKHKELTHYFNKSQNLKDGFVPDVKFDPEYPGITDSIQETFSSVTSEFDCPLSPMLSSPLVRERHHVQPYKPQPYSLDYRFQAEKSAGGPRESPEAAVEADSAIKTAENLDKFFRRTLPFSRAFGRYGRGEYEFAEPSGVLYLHDVTLAICDTRNHRIVVYNQDGTYQRTIGQPRRIPDLPETAEEIDRTFQRIEGKLYFPYRLAQCPSTKNIVVVERPPNPGVQIFTFGGYFVRCFGNSYLQNPRGVAVDERGLILVLESKTMNFFIFTQEGDLINKSVLGTLVFPNDVVARQGTIYISDNRHHSVKCFDYSLNYKESIGNESLTYYPISVGFNYKGELVITDNHNTFNITIFDSVGNFIRGFKSRVKHANCYNVALHPFLPELVVTTKECQVLVFYYGWGN